MMGKRLTKCVCAAIVLSLLVTGMGFLNVQDVKADNPNVDAVKYQKNKTSVMVRFKSRKTDRYLKLGKRLNNCTNIQVKSSKKSVLEAANYPKTVNGLTENKILLTGKKKGTATVTIKYKKPGSTKYSTIKQKVKVVNYENPFKKVKLDGKNITKKFNKRPGFGRLDVNGKFRLYVKAANGWKISKMYVTYYSNGKYKKAKYTNNTTKKILAGKNCSVYITMVSKKNGAVETIDITEAR